MEKSNKPLTLKQQTKLMDALCETRSELFVSLCLYAGLRRNEALSLLWTDVHLDEKPYLDVRHITPKSGVSCRTVSISPQLQEILQRWKSRSEDTQVVHETAEKVMTDVREQVNFRVTPPLLRHTYVSELQKGNSKK